MRLFLVIFLIFGRCSTNEISRRAIFDCNRIDVTFCCTSRVRSLCAEQCKDVQCGGPETEVGNGNTFRGNGRQGDSQPEFQIERMTTPPPMDPSGQFIPPFRPQPMIHDGSAELLRPTETTPPPPTSTPFTQTSLQGFPTLIPFEPNIDDIEDRKIIDTEFTDRPFIHSTIVQTRLHSAWSNEGGKSEETSFESAAEQSYRAPHTASVAALRCIIRGDNCRSRSFRLTKHWINIGEYDEYDQKEARIETTTIPVQAETAIVFTRKAAQSAGIAMPKSFISEEVTPSGESLLSGQTNIKSNAQYYHKPRPMHAMGGKKE
ncbi:hypothetical protein OSTOST_10425, partial [Ostertagia ostertagi]